MTYEQYTETASESETLAIKTIEFLEQSFNLKNLVLVKHRPRLEPFQLLINKWNGFNFQTWLQQISQIELPVPEDLTLKYENSYYYFSGLDFLNQEIFILILPEKPADQIIQKALHPWQSRQRFLLNVKQAERIKAETNQGNLISQLLHDVQSLINFQPQVIPDPDLDFRVQYQNKVNEDLLFFVRPTELLQFISPIEDLIYASVQLLGIERQDFSLTISGKIDDIEIDAELFSKALNEIVLNAKQSAENNKGKWNIQVRQILGKSPFISRNWLQIVVKDSGVGIKPDYFPFLTDPFFTTKKMEGHTGFGLSNAKKILEAHGGLLQIASENGHGCEVQLIFPYQNDESKNTDY